MDTCEPNPLLTELYEEYAEWYITLAEENGVLPRSISGVAGDGSQFIYLFDNLDLHHMVRNKYLRFVLDEHRSVAYAYGGLALRGDSDQGEIHEVLDVVAADAERYVMGQWRVRRGGCGEVSDLEHLGTKEGDDPEKHPGTWFLAGALRFTRTEQVRFGAIWQEAKAGVIFNTRPVG
ncbi:MAG: hypothetical protein HGB29_01270 [Chlorobiaceae bacterium]|nr:hypothetical protein [Chlorobiaceae bacterium]NTW73477.1 hypothetical protein [Chlorobiaceae bacterium]